MTTVIPSLQVLAKALGGEMSNGRVLAPGPGHSPSDRSLSVKLDSSAPDGFVVHSFAGDDPITCKDFVRAKAGLEPFKPNGNGRNGRMSDADIERAVMQVAMGVSDKPKGRVIATFDYVDVDGSLLYQVLKYDPKNFRQRRPDGNGGWVWSLGDVRRVPYRWPEPLKYLDATVFVCEGEKDTDRVASLGHCATCVAAGKWTEDCIKALTDRHVLILQDNDSTGHKKATDAARALHGTAASIRIVLLPDLPQKGDVSDWLDFDPHRAEKLADVCFAVPEWEWTPDDAPDNNDASKKEAKPTSTSLVCINIAAWHSVPIPERQWVVHDRVPSHC
jgi:hypothetical protein